MDSILGRSIGFRYISSIINSLFLFKKIEYDILKNVDKIIYISPLTLEEQKNEYPKLKEKMFFYQFLIIKKEYIKTITKSKKNIE